MSAERLQKIISSAGLASRRQAEKWILEGRVTVNGQVVRELGAKADWDTDRHDSGWSVTWQMSSPPRGNVQSSILARLLAPRREAG